MESDHDHKGYSEEKCTRCGWVMGHPPLNCNNDDTPHVFPSQLDRDPVWMEWMAAAAGATSLGASSQVFTVGVRSHNGTWFAHFANLEYDGHPKWSVPSVVDEMRKRALTEIGVLRRDVSARESVLDGLPSVAYPPPEDE